MDITKFLTKKIGEWEKGTVQVTDGLVFSPYQTVRQIEFYTSSKYITGSNNKDRRGRVKPFYNITNYRVNVAMRATDIDTKDIQITPDNADAIVSSVFLQREAYEWMKESDFAKTLNEMGFTRAKYGGLLVKKCVYEDEDEKELKIDVLDWRNTITDPVNVTKLVIEKHFMTAEDLSCKEDVWNNVRQAMDAANKSSDGKIVVYEVTGTFPESWSPEGGDEYTYKLQTFFVTKDIKGGMTLYHEFLEEQKYKYLEWERVPGRGLGRGVVEEGFEAQQWTNDAIIREKEAMELGSKLVFKSTDPNIQNNVLTDVENGQVIKITQGSDFAQANMLTNAIPEFQNLVDKWNSQYERASATYGAITGETMPSNTPYRTTAILNSEATSYFDYRREEMGIFLTEIFEDWVIPFIIETKAKKHVLNSEFSSDELEMIDDAYATYKANEQVMQSILSGKPVYASEFKSLVQSTKDLLNKTKSRRFMEIPDNFYKDIDCKVTVVTTGEQKNKGATLESLNNILTTIAKAPQVMSDPNLLAIFNEIISMSGVGIMPLKPTEQPVQPAPTVSQPTPEVTPQ